MNIGVVCSEKFSNTLLMQIDNCSKENNISATVDSYNSEHLIIECIENYDIIILDIDAKSVDCIKIAKEINKIKDKFLTDTPYLIFITDKTNQIMNISKELPYAIIFKQDIDDILKKCLIKINNKIIKDTKYSIKVGRASKFLSIEKILFVEKEKNYVVFHTEKNKYKERSSIDEKLSDLSDYGFIRTHVGYLVNLKKISEISNNKIILNTGQEIPISRKYKNHIKEIINRK